LAAHPQGKRTRIEIYSKWKL